MKYVGGLYILLILIMFVNLLDTTVFNNTYLGITMFVTMGIFLVGTIFYINAKQMNNTNDEK